MSSDPHRPQAIQRATEDLAAGRRWNAANRLQGYLSTHPVDAEARTMLGELLLEMGDLVDAGRVLVAGERDDPQARGAIAAWMAVLEEAPAEHLELLAGQGLTEPTVIDRLGPIGRGRVAPLAERARHELSRDGGGGQHDGEPAGFVEKAGCTLGCGAFVAVMVAGVVQIAKWLGL